MRQKGIFDGDLMIIDRAKTPVTGSVVIAALNGDMVCKILDKEGRRLLAANDRYAPIVISEELDCIIEGVVVHSIRYHC